MTTDLTFFTNKLDAALLDHFTAMLAQPAEVILSEYLVVQQGGE
jgi:hypothetical protein